MSLCGSIVFFCDHPHLHVHHATSLFRLLGADRSSRTLANVLPAGSFDMRDRGMGPEPGQPSARSTVVEAGSPKALLDLKTDSTLVHASIPGSTLAAQVAADLGHEIAKDVRGDFVPLDTILTLGGQDHFSLSSSHEWRFIGRGTLSVSLFGYGLPGDWDQYRERVFSVPAIRQVRSDMEDLLGPVQTYASWSY